MQLIAKKRQKLGKSSRGLRLQKKLPAVVFGKGIESVPVQVDYLAFTKVFAQAGETELVEVLLDGSTDKVLIKELQFDPLTNQVIHVSFHKVNLKDKIQANIPVEVVGEEQNALVKSKEALVLVLLNEITVEALPTDLPRIFEVDVSALSEIGAGITVEELVFDKAKVELVDVEPSELIVKLDYAVQLESEADVSEEASIENLQATKEKPATDEESEE